MPGQNWEAEIDKAFKEAHVILLLLSPRSVDKRGFVQREANDALENLRYKKPTDIYAIPLILEDCEVPQQISQRLQYIDMSTADAWPQVLAALKVAAEQYSIEVTNGTSAGPFQVFTEVFTDQWAGQPGHDIKIEYPRFSSAQLITTANELSLYFSGRAVQNLINSRQSPQDQCPDLFPASGDFTATNGHWESYGIAFASTSYLSLSYDVSWYGAGAAHPNSHFETFNFILAERITKLELVDFFQTPELAASIISDAAIKDLCREYWSRNNQKPDEDQLRRFMEGAGPDLDNFCCFTVSSDGFQFLFAPYQVSSYADGRWSVEISFYELLEALRPNGPHTLITGKA